LKQSMAAAPSVSQQFQTTLNELYPGAVELPVFLARLKPWLAGYGFTKGKVLPMLAACRDEICAPLNAQIENQFGQPFQLGSLAGMIMCGKTGFAAASHHAPMEDGEERFLIIAGPHIGINEHGQIGKVHRFGQHADSAACGALCGLLDDLKSNGLPSGGVVAPQMDSHDWEMSIVKYKIAQSLVNAHAQPPFTLAAVTQKAYDNIHETVHSLMHHTVSHGPHHGAAPEYLVLSIVHIHGPDFHDYVWLGNAEGVLKSEKKVVTAEAQAALKQA